VPNVIKTINATRTSLLNDITLIDGDNATTAPLITGTSNSGGNKGRNKKSASKSNGTESTEGNDSNEGNDDGESSESADGE